MEAEGYTRRLKVTAHGKTELDMVYTNEEATLVETLEMYEQWLQEDKHKFVGLDLEYTKEDLVFDNDLAVVQLAMRTHMLVYHYCW